MKVSLNCLSGSLNRVAIVGGGLSGTLAASTLKQRLGSNVDVTILDANSRKIGGRLLGGLLCDDDYFVGDMGAQFIQPSADFRFTQLCNQMHQIGMLKPWNGRFGVLGSQAGGFLPTSVIQSAIPKTNDDDSSFLASVDNGDFCNFNRSSMFGVPTYTATPSMADWCERILQTQPGIKQTLNFTLHEAMPISMKNDQNPLSQTDIVWSLKKRNSASQCTNNELYFDAIILSTHNPLLASTTIDNILISYQEKEGETVGQRLRKLSKELTNVRKLKKPILSFAYLLQSKLSKTLPFDAVTIPGSSTIQFLCRDSSKSASNQVEQSQYELWKGISTSSFAEQHIQDKCYLDSHLEKELQGLLSTHCQAKITPKFLGSKLWRAAFTQPTLDLKEDCITLEPWRLIIAGDFLREYSNPIEAAAVSGIEAGDRMANILSRQDVP